MNLTRLLLSAAFAAGSVVLAAPAHAVDPGAPGTYTFEAEDGESATWTITRCPDPNDDHCVFVSSTGSNKRAPWTANAYWTVGSWIIFVSQSDAILCADGSTAPGVNNYSWDDTSLNGYASINTGGACGSDAANVAIPFALTRTGSGPVQYPTAPIYEAPVTPPPAQPLAPAEVPPAPAPMPAESDPAIVATPQQIPNYSDPLTEAIVSEPGFNR